MTAERVHRRWPWMIALVLALALVALAALVWWLPARWAWRCVRADYPAVQVDAVTGTLWDGHMRGLVVGSQRLGTLHWTLDRSALMGHVRGNIDVRGAGITASGGFARAADGALVIQGAQFQLPLQRLRAWWPAGVVLDGTLRGTIAAARLVHGWPVRLDAQLAWQDALIVMQGRRVALGTWESRWHASGGTVLTAQLHDAGNGPVQLRGTFTATPLGWRLDAVLTPRVADPALHWWLQQVGTPAPNGGVRVERRGGLMMGAM